MKKSIVISLLTVVILFYTSIYSFASTGRVTTDTLRLRNDASLDASIIALLSINDEVEILEEKNGWYKVKATVNGQEQTGYVSKDYIQILEGEVLEGNTENNTNENNNQEGTNNGEGNTENNEKQENKIMVKVISVGVKVYITPTINSLVLETMEEEKQVQIVSELDGWSYVTVGNVKGWVRTENIVEKEASETEQNSSLRTGYISGSSVNFREEANSTSKSILKLKRNAKVDVLAEETNGWIKIKYDGRVGYVASQYVSDKKIQTTTRSSTKSTTKKDTENVTKTNTTKGVVTEKQENITPNKNATGSDIVAYAKKYLGNKYVYGGSSPSGFDCSGFTSYVYKHFGYSLSRSSSAQASNGKAVSKSEMVAGDIVCFARTSGSKKVGHVGIYIGGGKFIHAANSRKGVIISNVSGDGFYFVCARRIINK